MARTHVVRVGVMTLLMVVMAALVFAQGQPVRVYVFTAESRFVNDEAQDRLDSVQDLIKALRTKDREVLLVTNRADAEMTVEVLGRALVSGGFRSSFQDYTSGRHRGNRDPKATIWAAITVGDVSTELSADCGTVLFAVWSEAARNMASDVVRWMIENQRLFDVPPTTDPPAKNVGPPPAPAAPDRELFNSGNTYAVANRPTAPATFTLSRPHLVVMISTYHWNDGRGTSAGAISLVDSIGQIYGPWQATGSAGQGGVPNANWTCTPNVEIPAGTYTIVDSEAATWSQNAESGGRGMAVVKGSPVGSTR
ncbi:MAG: hypothetical protein WCP29_18310 [Acidobacteriota bacterium]